MAAPLKTVLKTLSASSRRHCLKNWTRSARYFERDENSIYEKGETRRDRYVNIPQKPPKPHPETPKKGLYETNPEKGKVFDRKPFPVKLKAEKRYKWCSCGHSHNQPLCDGSHKVYNRHVPESYSSFFPVIFEVEKDGNYWLCNCKQTNNRPFCDGSHKALEAEGKKR